MGLEYPIASLRVPGSRVMALVDKNLYPGNVYWVDDSGTDGAGYGSSPLKPVASLDYAISLCTADAQDTILLMAGHAETVGSVTVDIAGVRIVGIGDGTLTPTLTFDTTTDEINVTAANVTIENLRLVSSVNSLVNFFDIDAAHCTVRDVDMVTSSATECVCFINFATTVDDLRIEGCTAYQPSDPEGTDAAAGTGFLYLVDSERVFVIDCTVIGNFETGFIHNKTTKCQDLFVEGCRTRMALAGTEQFNLVAASTGHVHDSRLHTSNAADASVAEMLGTIDTLFWVAPSVVCSNDSAGGGELMVAGGGAAACS